MRDIDLEYITETLTGKKSSDSTDEEPEPSSTDRSDRTLAEKVKQNGNIHEAVRDIVHESAKDDQFGLITEEEEAVLEKSQEQKQKELYEILDNLDRELEGKCPKEVAAVFTSLMDIQSQLSIQKTDGVITVRTRLKDFFSLDSHEETKKFNFQEITLIFTPEEIFAVRRRLDRIDDDHPMLPFFTTIIDQAQDIVQYNEVSGRLLIQLTNYFISKLENEGHAKSSKTIDFKERHIRCTKSFQKALNELRDDESIVTKHLKSHPILNNLPRYLRKLIYIRLGIYDPSELTGAIHFIRENLGKYNRARNIVQMDFSRFFMQQNNLLLRQKLILKLHQDILKYTGEVFEDELKSCMAELQSVIDEIESNIDALDPGSSEYESLLKKKLSMQRKVEERRRKLDVVKSQERLIDVQHHMISGALDRFEKNEEMNKRLEDQVSKIRQKPQIASNNTKSPKKKPANRMVMSKSRKKE